MNMQEYDFTLRFHLKEPNADPKSYIGQLYEHGCDDALIGFGKMGGISLNFIREADSAVGAISSAVENVKAAIPDAVLVEATPDLVGLTDIAKVIDCSRQNTRKMLSEDDGRVPTPMYDGKPSLWHLAQVLEWLKCNSSHTVDESLLSVAQFNMHLNRQNRQVEIDPELKEKAERLLQMVS